MYGDSANESADVRVHVDAPLERGSVSPPTQSTVRPDQPEIMNMTFPVGDSPMAARLETTAVTVGV